MKTKEIRVYVLDINNGIVKQDITLKDLKTKKQKEAFKKEAEIVGSVYSLKGFERAINNEELFLDTAYILID